MGDGGLFHAGKDRYLSDEINRLVLLDHVDIAILKFIDDAVLAFGDESERSKRIILLVNDRPGRIHADRVSLP